MTKDRTSTAETIPQRPALATNSTPTVSDDQAPEVRHAMARFRSAARTVASYEAIDSADMTPDEHNTWYDKLNVMREARAVLVDAGQVHLIDDSTPTTTAPSTPVTTPAPPVERPLPTEPTARRRTLNLRGW